MQNGNNEVLFFYSNKPSCGKYGGKGGSSITIYKNGQVLQEEYKFGEDKSISQEIMILTNKDMKKILKIISKNTKKINAYPDKMYCCRDGNMYKFIFDSKIIEGDNGIDNHLFVIIKKILSVVNISKRRKKVSL